MSVLDDVLKMIGIEEKEKKEFEKEKFDIVDWWRKTIGSLYYCGGTPWIYTVWTFEENETDRSHWLRVQIESELDAKCSAEMGYTGYETLETDQDDVDFNSVYMEWDYSRTPAK